MKPFSNWDMRNLTAHKNDFILRNQAKHFTSAKLMCELCCLRCPLFSSPTDARCQILLKQFLKDQDLSAVLVERISSATAVGGSLQGKLFERTQGTLILFQFQVSSSQLGLTYGKMEFILKKQDYLLEVKGNYAAKSQEVNGSRNVKAAWLLWVLFQSLYMFVSCLASSLCEEWFSLHPQCMVKKDGHASPPNSYVRGLN